MLKKAVVGLLVIGGLIWVGQGNNGNKLGNTGSTVVQKGTDAGGGILDAISGTLSGLGK